MPQTHHRQTMSALLATHTAIRVARDVGYPKIELPPPPSPASTPVEVIYQVEPILMRDFPEPVIENLSAPVGLIVFFIACFATVLILVAWGIFGR